MNQRNIAASVRTRLLNKDCAEKLDFNLLITRLCAGADAPRQLPSEGAVLSRLKSQKFGLMQDLLPGKMPVKMEEPEPVETLA